LIADGTSDLLCLSCRGHGAAQPGPAPGEDVADR
jgi:hypothetical protein